MSVAEVVILSPFDGWVAPLEEVPDAVFAERMMGDGVAVEPISGVLRAPFDGEIISVPPSAHAVTIRGPEGVEVLMHVGLDTVALRGAGFEARVKAGDRVRAGDALIEVDLDAVGRGARSLITPVVVTGEGFLVASRITGRQVIAGEPLMIVRRVNTAVFDKSLAGEAAQRRVSVPLPHGLHARPAARVAACAKGFSAAMTVRMGERTVNASSAVGLMTLGVRRDDEIELTATGPDAQAAVDAVAELILSGMGEREEAAPPPAPTPLASPVADMDGGLVLRGVCAAPGLAVGVTVRLGVSDLAVETDGRGASRERQALEDALDVVKARLHASGRDDPHRRSIFAAHAAFLEDPDLLSAAQAAISDGRSAGFAWRSAIRAGIAELRSLDDPRLAERIDDLVDLERQVLTVLAGAPAAVAPDLPENAIVLAEAMTPSQFAALDLSRLAGLCTGDGGPTSHVAILAAAAGVPAVVAAGPGVARISDGETVILDADGARLIVAPTPTALQKAREAVAGRARLSAERRAKAAREARLADGTRIEVFANVGGVADAVAAAAAGAEGCGLLRTEFLFLDRQTPPTEDEQLAEYQGIVDAFAGKPVIVRTLDCGGDKPLPYLPLAPEENPALGLRGVRTSLARPDLLRTQLRAILRVEPYGLCKIMLPMVSSVAEIRAVRTILDEEARALGRAETPWLGVMVETPAAALLADQLAREADFLSIGTNDLTQYVLAMDRGNPQLAPQLDALHPAVLRAIAQAVQGGQAARFVGVCGGLASDPVAAPLLVGLGVTELSAVPAVVAELKAVLGGVTLARCRELAQEALRQDSADAVRALAFRLLSARETEPA